MAKHKNLMQAKCTVRNNCCSLLTNLMLTIGQVGPLCGGEAALIDPPSEPVSFLHKFNRTMTIKILSSSSKIPKRQLVSEI